MASRFSRGMILGAALVGFGSQARAQTTSDRAAAIAIFPRVVAADFSTMSQTGTETLETDTVIQISNTSTEPALLHCFYVDATGTCSVSGTACQADFGIPTCPTVLDVCLPNWVETDFRVYVTPRQPLAWRVSQGLSGDQFPLDGIATRGPQGDDNAGSAIPPVRKHPISLPVPGFEIESWLGELKCMVVDASGHGIARNIIKGEATVESSSAGTAGPEVINVALLERANAVGIPAIGGDVNGDGVLELGGDAGEYEGCSNVLIVDHFFGSSSPLDSGSADNIAREFLTLVPCSEDLRNQVPGATTAQFLVFNEFEQRFSTSAKVDCYFAKPMDLIDTSDEERSIFSAAVAGTVVGQTRIRGVSGGLTGILSEGGTSIIAGSSASNLHQQGLRELPDRIVLP